MCISDSFGFSVPVEVSGVYTSILTPRSTWADTSAYDDQAEKLVAMFIENFEKFEEHVNEDVRAAAPQSALAAE